jgi:hypothetical protein
MYAYLLKYSTNPSMQLTKQAAQHAKIARTAVKSIALDNRSINNGLNEWRFRRWYKRRAERGIGNGVVSTYGFHPAQLPEKRH